MARLFPFRSEPQTGDGQPRVVGLEGEDADAVFGALSSTTARRIYARLDDDPATPSDVADAVDTSIQNVRYHLENLEAAGLVEVVDTWYSSRGNEMSVYATTDGPLIVTSDDSNASQLRTALSRLLGGVGVLAGASLLVQYGLTEWVGPAGTASEGPATAEDDPDEPTDTDAEPAGDGPADDDAGAPTDDGDEFDTAATDDDDTTDDAAADDTTDDATAGEIDETEDTDDDTTDETDDATTDDAAADNATADDSGANETADGIEAADGGPEAAETVLTAVPPGLLFFLGGVTVLLVVAAYWYWSRPAY